MFHSNLLPERIMKNLEFCDAMVGFLRDISLTDLQQRASKLFCAYVRENRKAYPLLYAFMAERLAECVWWNADLRRAA
jgi:hypothetical protein